MPSSWRVREFKGGQQRRYCLPTGVANLPFNPHEIPWIGTPHDRSYSFAIVGCVAEQNVAHRNKFRLSDPMGFDRVRCCRLATIEQQLAGLEEHAGVIIRRRRAEISYWARFAVGHVLYVQGRRLLGRAFDPHTRRFIGRDAPSRSQSVRFLRFRMAQSRTSSPRHCGSSRG